MPTNDPRAVLLSGLSDPTNWNVQGEFDSLTFASYTDAKKAEVLFGRMQRALEEALKDAARYRWLRHNAERMSGGSLGKSLGLLVPDAGHVNDIGSWPADENALDSAVDVLIEGKVSE